MINLLVVALVLFAVFFISSKSGKTVVKYVSKRIRSATGGKGGFPVGIALVLVILLVLMGLRSGGLVEGYSEDPGVSCNDDMVPLMTNANLACPTTREFCDMTVDQWSLHENKVFYPDDDEQTAMAALRAAADGRKYTSWGTGSGGPDDLVLVSDMCPCLCAPNDTPVQISEAHGGWVGIPVAEWGRHSTSPRCEEGLCGAPPTPVVSPTPTPTPTPKLPTLYNDCQNGVYGQSTSVIYQGAPCCKEASQTYPYNGNNCRDFGSPGDMEKCLMGYQESTDKDHFFQVGGGTTDGTTDGTPCCEVFDVC